MYAGKVVMCLLSQQRHHCDYYCIAMELERTFSSYQKEKQHLLGEKEFFRKRVKKVNTRAITGLIMLVKERKKTGDGALNFWDQYCCNILFLYITFYLLFFFFIPYI